MGIVAASAAAVATLVRELTKREAKVELKVEFRRNATHYARTRSESIDPLEQVRAGGHVARSHNPLDYYEARLDHL